MALKPGLPALRHRVQASGPVGQRFPPSSQERTDVAREECEKKGGRGEPRSLLISQQPWERSRGGGAEFQNNLQT